MKTKAKLLCSSLLLSQKVSMGYHHGWVTGVRSGIRTNLEFSDALRREWGEAKLAMSKEEVISGTYYNSDTDIARPVKGTVDKKTQRAAWTFADGKDTNIVMEAGINNLTQDQTVPLVHFGKDTA